MNLRNSVPAASRGGHKRLRRVSTCALALCCALLAAACSAGPDPDAPYATAGLNASTVNAAPGEPVAIGVPVAIKTGKITLESATMLPLPGFPVPQFVGVGLVRSKGWDGAAEGWPPRDIPGTTIRPLSGAVVTGGHLAVIYYAFRGNKKGVTYYTAGIRLTYRSGAGERTATLYQAGVDCVMPNPRAAKHNCNISAAANKTIAKLA